VLQARVLFCFQMDAVQGAKMQHTSSRPIQATQALAGGL